MPAGFVTSRCGPRERAGTAAADARGRRLPLPAAAAAHRQHPHGRVEQRRHAVADDAREPGGSQVRAFSHVLRAFLDWWLSGLVIYGTGLAGVPLPVGAWRSPCYGGLPVLLMMAARTAAAARIAGS